MWLLAAVAVSSLEYYRELSRRGSPRQRIARLGVSCCFPPCAQGFPAGKNTMPASTLGAAVLDVLTWSERMTRERERLGSLRQYLITGPGRQGVPLILARCSRGHSHSAGYSSEACKRSSS
jgi:hypothetical protein